MDTNIYSPEKKFRLGRGQMVGIGIIIVIVIFGLWYWISNREGIDLKVLSTAPQGELVADVPKEFILAADAKIVSSEVKEATTAEGVPPFTVSMATYTTVVSSNDLFVAYQEFLKKNGYTLVRSDGSAGGIGNIWAKNENKSVSINIRDLSAIEGGKGREVTVVVSSQIVQ